MLDRAVPLPRATALGTDCDPMLLEIFNNLFMTIAEQMGVTLQNTALFGERQGAPRLLLRGVRRRGPADRQRAAHAGASGLDGRIGAAPSCASRARRACGPGDVYALNNPYNGGTHLPDVTRGHAGVRRGWRACCSSPPAGRTTPISAASRPGSMPPDSVSIEQEGVLFDDFHAGGGRPPARGRAAASCCAAAPYPARNPQQNVADLQAQIAACQKGANELHAHGGAVRPGDGARPIWAMSGPMPRPASAG